jgi:hypothetical protein
MAYEAEPDTSPPFPLIFLLLYFFIPFHSILLRKEKKQRCSVCLARHFYGDPANNRPLPRFKPAADGITETFKFHIKRKKKKRKKKEIMTGFSKRALIVVISYINILYA